MQDLPLNTSQRFFFLFLFLFYLRLSFTNIHESNDCRGRGGHFFNSSLPLPLASQTLRHQPGDYCTELTYAHSQQSKSNREPLVSERKSLTTKNLAFSPELFSSLNNTSNYSSSSNFSNKGIGNRFHFIETTRVYGILDSVYHYLLFFKQFLYLYL